MSALASQLSEDEIAELCAFADGTLPAARRPAVEAWVAASPELVEMVELQRRSLAATRALADEPASASLHATQEAQRRMLRVRRHRFRLAAGLSTVGVLAAAVATTLVLSLGGGPAAPSVVDAARLAMQPPSEPAPAPSGNGFTLAVSVQGVAFPDFATEYGWRAAGVRRGSLDGRLAKVVYYEKDGRRIGYAIVAGGALPRPTGARATALGGKLYQTLRLDAQTAVTWRRGGHTCVLIGPAPAAQLLALASWHDDTLP
jgi:anti-sigma factor RsiW